MVSSWLIGGNGSGKTTALRHLAAAFEENSQIVLLDDTDQLDRETLQGNFQALNDDVIVVAARTEPSGSPQLRLQPWKTDEILEYLLTAHSQECGSVIERLGGEVRKSWDPEVARAMLDEMAEDASLSNVVAALVSHVRNQLGSPGQFETARQFCLEESNAPHKRTWWMRSKFSRLPTIVKKPAKA